MMDKSKQDVAPTGRRFDKEFQEQSVRLVTEQGYTFVAAAKAVGVSSRSLRLWHAKLAPKPKPCGPEASIEELRNEIQRLRKQLHRTELEREILKKATAYFAKESL